jgi:hypothetical protein
MNVLILGPRSDFAGARKVLRGTRKLSTPGGGQLMSAWRMPAPEGIAWCVHGGGHPRGVNSIDAHRERERVTARLDDDNQGVAAIDTPGGRTLERSRRRSEPFSGLTRKRLVERLLPAPVKTSVAPTKFVMRSRKRLMSRLFTRSHKKAFSRCRESGRSCRHSAHVVSDVSSPTCPIFPERDADGRYEIFDGAAAGGEIARSALELCAVCPALRACAAWFDGLPAKQRPRGVVAGRLNLDARPRRRAA